MNWLEYCEVRDDRDKMRSYKYCADERGVIIRDILPGIMADIAICDAHIVDALDKIKEIRELLEVKS